MNFNSTPGEQAVFTFLSKPDNIGRMIAFSERGLPALTGVAAALETNFANQPDFPLSSNQNRQTVGRMVKSILAPFGYIPSENALEKGRRLRDFAEANFFKTSAIYEQKVQPILGLEITVKEIQEHN